MKLNAAPIYILVAILITFTSTIGFACQNYVNCTGSTPYCSLTSGYCCAGSYEYACQDSSGHLFCSPSSTCSSGGGGGGGGGGCQNFVNCTGSTPYCSLTSGYCCAGSNEYACQDSSGNGFCSPSSTCGSGGGGGGGGCQSFVNCTGSTPYCSLTNGYCCAGSNEYACQDSSGNMFCSPSSTCGTGGGGGGGGCQSFVNCTGSTPYCSLTNGYCCAGSNEYACQDSSGNMFCSPSSTCSSGGGGGGGGCQNYVNCTGSTPYCSLTNGYCCAGSNEYACQDSSGNMFCSPSSTCGSGGGGGGGGCQNYVNCTGSTPYCSLTSGYCCAGSNEYACQDSSGNLFCSPSSTCGSGGGGGGGGCQNYVNCTGSTPYCSLTSGYCCAGSNEYACQDSSGNLFCSTSSTCGTGGGGGGGCQNYVNCTGSTPFCSLTSGYCCAGSNQYACQDSSGNGFCSPSSTCSSGGGGGCQNYVNCTGSTPYCSLTSGYCCAGSNEYACQDSSGNMFCSPSSTCGTGGGGGGCQNYVNCTGSTPYCSLTNGYCCAGSNEYACQDSSGNMFCSTSSTCGTGGGGGGGCQNYVNCTGSTPYCSLTSGYCCAGSNEYACQDSSGHLFCSTSSTCNSGGGGCQNNVNCTGSTPYCSLTNGYCCAGSNEYACQDSSGNGFCSSSSTCGSGGGGCQNNVNCTGSTPYCSLTSGYCCAGSNEYACQDSSGNMFCSPSSTCGSGSGGGGDCQNYVSCTGSTPYCSLTSGYCCAEPNEYVCSDSSGNMFCSTSNTCGSGAGGDTSIFGLSVSTLQDGSYTNNAFLNISGTVTRRADLKSLTINRQNVTVASNGSFTYDLILKPKKNKITVTAIDNSNLKKIETRTVNYDSIAPSIKISVPAVNSKTGTSYMTVAGALKETATVKVTVNGSSPQSAVIIGKKFSAAVNLIPGSNTIDFGATDLAGNVSHIQRTVIYDNAPPILAVNNPAMDSTTNQKLLFLSGTVSDLLSKVKSVSITMNGKKFKPAVIAGTFQQKLAFSAVQQYAIAVTATDEVGNSSTVYRTIIYQP